VSVRTLRFYDRIGLLPPSRRTESGYRLYGDTELARLQRILALRFLGFSLSEVEQVLQQSPEGLREVLAEQRVMLRERRAQLDEVIAATERAEQLVQRDGRSWEALVSVIQAIEMNEKSDWRQKYFSDEQLKTFEELSEASYSEEARAALAARPSWTEDDQEKVDEQYAALYAGVRQAVAAGQPPDGEEGQALASQAIGLLEAFTGGNPAVAEGLQSWWTRYQELPEDERPFQIPLTSEESAFLDRAKAIYQQRR
jgi:DNA-binding transcriptional MerR regulator